MSSANTSHRAKNHVCVIGTGVAGLGAIKNLTERGFTVTGLEQSESIGGLWHISEDPNRLSAMPGTKLNVSKYTTCYSDFPMPQDYPDYPSATQYENYLNAYALRFGLFVHIRFLTRVTKVARDENSNCWLVSTRDESTGVSRVDRFGRVVVATGMLNKAHIPEIPGRSKFTGVILHSREFKDPSKFEGKNVLVLGIGSTAVDSICFLKQAGVRKIYLAHRGRFQVLPRFFQGRPIDAVFSRRAFILLRLIARFSTRLCESLFYAGLQFVQNKAFPYLQSHRSFTAPRTGRSILHRYPVMSDELPLYLKAGDISIMHAIEEITGPSSVRFTDGETIDHLDAIILCSGYRQDFSVIEGPGRPDDPLYAPDRFRKLKETKFYNDDVTFPRLYNGVLSEQYPESLAVLGHLSLIPKFAILTNELASMAIASLWRGDCPLPTNRAIRSDIDAHYKFVCRTLQHGPIINTGIRLDGGKTYQWLNETAGTGVREYIESWGWKGWKFWWQHRSVWNLLMDGPDVPAVYRLIDTGRGRTAWAGAAEAIIRANVKGC